jgi:hypothetical protein
MCVDLINPAQDRVKLGTYVNAVHKGQVISWPAEWLQAFEEELYSVEIIIAYSEVMQPERLE